MPPQTGIVVAFDVYGTLLSTESIATKLSTYFGDEKAQLIAASWRRYQLEYTWRANSMGIYYDFAVFTCRSLRNAVVEAGLSLDEDAEKDVIKAYDSLSTFPDVQSTLEKLRQMEDLKVVAFSNGTYDMLHSSIKNVPELGSFGSEGDDIISVDECRKFKPAHEAYELLAKKMGKGPLSREEMGEIWLVSSNPFDVVGARAVGMNAVWVDRKMMGWQDRLVTSEGSQPTMVVNGLGDIVAIVQQALEKGSHK